MGVDPTGMPLDPKAFTFEKGREAQLFDGRLIYIYITIYIYAHVFAFSVLWPATSLSLCDCMRPDTLNQEGQLFGLRDQYELTALEERPIPPKLSQDGWGGLLSDLLNSLETCI